MAVEAVTLAEDDRCVCEATFGSPEVWPPFRCELKHRHVGAHSHADGSEIWRWGMNDPDFNAGPELRALRDKLEGLVSEWKEWGADEGPASSFSRRLREVLEELCFRRQHLFPKVRSLFQKPGIGLSNRSSAILPRECLINRGRVALAEPILVGQLQSVFGVPSASADPGSRHANGTRRFPPRPFEVARRSIHDVARFTRFKMKADRAPGVVLHGREQLVGSSRRPRKLSLFRDLSDPSLYECYP